MNLRSVFSIFGTTSLISLLTTTISQHVVVVAAFEFPSLPAFFSPALRTSTNGLPLSSLTAKKKALLRTISNTGNGKMASVETQAVVLKMVREIELAAPPPVDLLRNSREAVKLDGVWYLQYTSPSEVVVVASDDDENDNDDNNNLWKPVNASEGNSKIPTGNQFQARGTLSAGGVTVDTSNRPTLQTFDVAAGRVANDITLPNAKISVNGTFRPSDTVPIRAIVSFDAARIELLLSLGENKFTPLTITLDFVFSILAKIRGTTDTGWLETTYLGDDLRIGRGNKGTMFVLTRDPDAVQP